MTDNRQTYGWNKWPKDGEINMKLLFIYEWLSEDLAKMLYSGLSKWQGSGC